MQTHKDTPPRSVVVLVIAARMIQVLWRHAGDSTLHSAPLVGIVVIGVGDLELDNDLPPGSKDRPPVDVVLNRGHVDEPPVWLDDVLPSARPLLPRREVSPADRWGLAGRHT